ncbi:MAG: HAMP domain-containing histidine kinase, partial [Myxococcales bacterium]|nr:HAMP domain-containing histidine kinase [Myxococcales bacterium]
MIDDPSLLALLDDAPAAISVQRGAELRWEMANAMFCAMLGRGAIIGRTLAETLPDWSQLRRIVEGVMRDGKPFTAQQHRLLVDPAGTGALREAYFDFICQPLHDGDVVSGVLTFAVDVTKQVDSRKRLEATASELRRALDIRDDFLAVASHELKTPLTALRLQIHALQRSTARAADQQFSLEQLRARFDAADRQVQRLVQLIDALLDVSRLQEGPIAADLADADVVELVAEVVERARATAKANGSTIALEAPPSAQGRIDSSRVDQILTNLLSNAIKYGRGKPIGVRLVVDSAAARDPRRASISVSDEGIGIAPQDQERIFERFERAVSRTHY